MFYYVVMAMMISPKIFWWGYWLLILIKESLWKML